MMEQHVHQPAACILPSNAPNAHDQPYYGGTSSLGSRRALQERSGNRRDEPFDEVRLARAKALLKETEPQFIANVHQQKYKVVEVQDIPKIIRDSERLWNALWSCDDFRLYRQRQPKDLEVDTAPGQKSGRTWPDHMEASFCRALAAYPPMGRCKITPDRDHKLRGRNELIAHFIEVESGEDRGRKQVSSHIQVIKPYVAKDPIVNSYFMPPNPSEAKQMQNRHARSNRQRRSSNYVQNTRHHGSRYSTNRYTNWMQQRSMPYSTPASNMLRSHYASYKLDQFSMTIYEPIGRHDPRVIHEFTSLRRHPQLTNITINNPTRLVADYPQLSSYTHEELLRTQIISAEATIGLVGCKPSSNAELGIRLNLHWPSNLSRWKDFGCLVRFYDHGKLLRFGPGPGTSFATDQTGEEVEKWDSIDYDHENHTLGSVHFWSDFWARKIGLSMSELRKANNLMIHAQSLFGEEVIKYEQEAKEVKTNLANSFKSLTALQEISATVRSTGRKERLLLICWRFEQCLDENRPGETSWRNIIVNQDNSVAPAALPGAMPYNVQPIKEESKSGIHSQVVWDDEAIAMAAGTGMSSVSLQQAFEPSQALTLPEFSNMDMQGMSAATTVGEHLASQIYTDNDFDFTGGHIQLNLGQQMADQSMVLDNFHRDTAALQTTAMGYEHNSQDWHEMSFNDPYFSQTQTAGYNTIQAYDEHQDTPFSETGAQQHPDSAIEMSGHEQKHFSEPFQHLLSASAHVEASQAALTPEEALRQHAYLEQAASHSLSPHHQVEGFDGQHELQPHLYEQTHGIEECGPEHALQSIEFAARQDIAL